MSINEIKNAMLNYRDFYGGDISDTEAIKRATSKQELADILQKHDNFLDDMLSDAHSHLNNFKAKIGLDLI